MSSANLEEVLCSGPPVGVLDQAQLQEVIELPAPPVGMVQPRRVGLLDLEEDTHRRHLVEGRLHLGELDHGHPQAPDVHLVEVRVEATSVIIRNSSSVL